MNKSTDIAAQVATQLIKSLMPLPDGWRYAPHAFDPHVVHVVWPNHGAVSLHLRRRTIITGLGIPSPAPRGTDLPEGRGWKVKMVAMAIRMLKEGLGAE